MKINQNTLNEFVDLLPEKVCKERTRITKKSGFKTWDRAVRKKFGCAIDKWFCQHLKVRDSKGYVFVEGLNSIPEEFRGSEFFGSKMYPDAALVMPGGEFKIAIELDHGSKGSQIRNALTKASLSAKLGEYNRTIVLFFIEPPKSIASFRKGSEEEKILKLYQREFNTTLHLL